MTTLTQTHLSSLKLLNQGKVRDIYEVDDENILIVTTDRLSAFDVIMNEPIPFKGEVLTKMANFWFDKFSFLVSNHLTHKNPLDFVSKNESYQVINRSIVAKKLKPIPIEVIVRGYLIGSSWKEYELSNSICDIVLPTGLKLAEKLPNPIFTPSSKAEIGNQDENISFKECENLIGKELTSQLSLISLDLYKKAYEFAYDKGIIIADTKFEFGLDSLGKIHIIDEILTPDSSRFWPKDSYQLGMSPPSFDKQFVRDWLESINWSKSPPPPTLPDDVIQKTSKKYRQAFFKITGEKI